MKNIESNIGEIVMYQPDETIRLEVRVEDETVWLTQAQLVSLFHSSKANISEHISNIYEQGELTEKKQFGKSEQFKKKVSVYNGGTVLLLYYSGYTHATILLRYLSALLDKF